jgi:membrane protein DedA with SNARE-associated domain
MSTVEEQKVESLIRGIFPQIVLFAIVVGLSVLSHFGIVPPPNQLNNWLIQSFKTYGISVIALCSFLENLVGVNAYFPGAFTILTGMALTSGDPSKAFLTYLAIYLPSFLANLLSYRAGLLNEKRHREKAFTCQKSTILWFFLTYWHPHLAALTAFSAGAKHVVSFERFLKLSATVSLFWSVFWGLIIYHLGLPDQFAQNFFQIFLGYLAVWTLFDIFRWNKVRTSGPPR